MKFYAVRSGRVPGIYDTWSQCKQQTDGYKGSIFKSFGSYDEAVKFITEDLIMIPSNSNVVDENISTKTILFAQNLNATDVSPILAIKELSLGIQPMFYLPRETLPLLMESQEVHCNYIDLKMRLRIASSILPIHHILYVDGGHNKQTGVEAWGCVVNGNNDDMINKHKDIMQDLELKNVTLPVGNRTIIVSKFNDVKSQQNNGAELLALVAGLRIAIYSDENISIIYSDSDLCIKYWSFRLGASQRKSFDYVIH